MCLSVHNFVDYCSSAMLLTSGSQKWEMLGIISVELDSMSGSSRSNSLSTRSSSLSSGSVVEGYASNPKDYGSYLGVCWYGLHSFSCILKEAIDME